MARILVHYFVPSLMTFFLLKMSFGNSFGDSTPFGQKVIKVLGAHRKLFIFENKHEKQTLLIKLGQQTLLFQAKKLPDILEQFSRYSGHRSPKKRHCA